MKRVRVWALVCLAGVGLGGYAVVRIQHFYTLVFSGVGISPHSNLSFLSEESQKKLKKFLRNQHRTFFAAEGLVEALKTTFPFIKKVTIAYTTNKKLLIKMESIQPLFVFNNQIVVAEGNKQFACADFNSSHLALLPHFSTSQNGGIETISDECIEYISRLGPDVHTLYDVEWVDSSLIKFHEKQHPHITVLGSAETMADTVMQPACRTLVTMLAERKPRRTRDICDWCIDGRFKGQMIIFPGGRINV